MHTIGISGPLRVRRIIACAGLCALGLATARESAPALPGDNSATFTKPTAITNRYLPLSRLKRDVLEGKEGSGRTRVERTMKPGTRDFEVDGKKVSARIMEDREFVNGKLEEVTLDYFAQADDGTVYYMGEDVDMYKGGKVVGHGGAWMTGEHGARPGVILPGNPKVGDKFQSEAVPKIAEESDEVVSVTETVTVPAGTFKNCVKVKELVPGESAEYKYYAAGVGVVREVPAGGDLKLASHNKP